MKWLKWIFSFVLILTLVNNVEQKAFANQGISIYVNDELQSYSDKAIIENGNTIVPLRGIFESLGATVVWNAKTQTIDASKGSTKIWLKIGSKTAKVNGNAVTLAVAPKVKDGSTLVPLRFISESLGATVDWKGSTKSIIITSYSTGIVSAPEIFNYSRNSVDGIRATFFADNISGKTINYYTLHISTYNPVGDPSYDEFSDKSKFIIKYVGPVPPGESLVMYNLFTYQAWLDKIVIDKIDIQFSDGTKTTQKYGYSTIDSSGF